MTSSSPPLESRHDPNNNVCTAKTHSTSPLIPQSQLAPSNTIHKRATANLSMMKNATILLAMLFCAAAGEMLQSAAGEPTRIGGNIAGSIITIPTANPVPYNESCAVGTYVLNGSSIGIYCNTNDYSNWYYDWTSYATPINTSSDGSAKAD